MTSPQKTGGITVETGGSGNPVISEGAKSGSSPPVFGPRPRGRGRGRGQCQQPQGNTSNDNQNLNQNQDHNRGSNHNNRGYRGRGGRGRGRGRGGPGQYQQNHQNSGKKWGERTRNKQFLKQWTARVPFRRVKTTCVRYIRGQCVNNPNNEGEPCIKAHIVRRRTDRKCKFWAMDSCLMGDKCSYSHIVPCKFLFLRSGGYHDQDKCRYSHEPITEKSRDVLIEDLALDLAPKVIYHDFKEPHGKQIKTDNLLCGIKPNPLGLIQKSQPGTGTTVPPTENIYLSGSSEELNLAKPLEPPATTELISFKGFYQDTLESNSNSTSPSSLQPEPDLNGEGELMIMDEPESQNNEQVNAPTTTTTTESASEMTEIINGVWKRPVKWNVVPVVTGWINYSDIRESVAQGHTLIDPRLSFVPIKNKLKTVEELGPSKGDFQEQEYKNDNVNELQLQFMNGGGSMSMSDMFKTGVLGYDCPPTTVTSDRTSPKKIGSGSDEGDGDETEEELSPSKGDLQEQEHKIVNPNELLVQFMNGGGSMSMSEKFTTAVSDCPPTTVTVTSKTTSSKKIESDEDNGDETEENVKAEEAESSTDEIEENVKAEDAECSTDSD